MPEYKGFYIREGKEGDTDKYVINEPFYNSIVTKPDDVVMDIGAHIGTFVRRVADKVKLVMAYEPDPDNFRLLTLNTISNSKPLFNVGLRNAAVTGSRESVTELWLGNPSIHSTVQYRGRNSLLVPAVNFHDELQELKPSFLKVDIEGGEYDFWEDLTSLPVFVKRIAFEIHLNRPEWRIKGPQLTESFERQGFKWIRPPKFTKAGWTTNVIGERE